MGLSEGSRFGPYEIVAPLGAGGMGEVYRARDTRLGRMVAIKVLPPSVSSDPERRERFEREARAISSLNHPHICALYDLGREETPRGTVDFLVMEYVEGETLAERLTKGPLGGEQVLRFAAEIADALALAHGRGVVHRDLKPRNIMLTRTGIKILDFGLAKLMDVKSPTGGADSVLPTAPRELTAPGAILGTLQYMAPEQLEGKECDGRTDIFALGAVLYEMATGRKAFEGKSQASVIAAILERNPPPMSELNRQTTPVLDHIVKRCLAKDPDERWQAAADIALELRWAGDVSSRASKEETAVAALPRRPWVLALAGLGLVALVTLSVVAARMTGTARPVVPSFRQLTFPRGNASAARFTPDGKGVVYSAAWEGEPGRLFSMRVERPESTRMDFPDAELASFSRLGELLIILGRPAGAWLEAGTLARVPFSGGAPREIARGVIGADWSPDGSSFAVVREFGGKHRLEYPLGEVLYESDRFLCAPRVSPKGDKVAIYAGLENGTIGVAVVDRSRNVSILSEGWAVADRFLVWSPEGDEVWFTPSDAGWVRHLRAVNLAGEERDLLHLPGLMQINDMAADGRVLLNFGTLRQRTKCLPPGEEKEREISWLDTTAVQDLSSDGRTVLLSERRSGAGPSPEAAAYLQKTDGSPPIRFGECSPMALSPDGQWVLCHNERYEHFLVPTGPGEPRTWKVDGNEYSRRRWFADGRHILYADTKRAGKVRSYSLNVDDGAMEPITPEGFDCYDRSPDGQELLCAIEDVELTPPQQRWVIYSLQGGKTRPVPGLAQGEEALTWGDDGRWLFVQLRPLPLGRIDRLNLTTGRREPWHEVTVTDAAGFMPVGSWVWVAGGGRSYCYSWLTFLSELYLVEGLR